MSYYQDSRLFLLLLATLGGCTHRPIEEIVLADVAVKAAQKAKADALAPDIFRQAENYYLRAKRDYSDGYYGSCRTYSDKARLMGEQAEFAATLRQTQVKGAGQTNTPAEPFSGGD